MYYFRPTSIEKLIPGGLELHSPYFVDFVSLDFLPRRGIHDLSEMPIFVCFCCPCGDPSLSQLSSHPEPPSHDAVPGREGLPGLRLVGVLDSALLAFRWVAAACASDSCQRPGHNHIRHVSGRRLSCESSRSPRCWRGLSVLRA